tara:strand:- start:5114 stop:6787 length:1674 start_codon:yes stop_codon:yes gene_type:complete
MNLIIFLSSYFIIVTSLIGYGLAFQNYINKKLSIEFEFVLLGSALFWVLISYFTHFFLSHNYLHNEIIILFGLILLLIQKKKNKNLIKNYQTYIFIIFTILIFGLLASKTHDDFPYYHFPYAYYLTQEKLIIGVGNLNHGFRTPSSIFYLNSIFYLPYIKYFSFNFGATILFGISNLILIFKLKNDLKLKNYDFIFYLTLLSFLFINIFFYRLSEHGTDRSAQILILILFIEILGLQRDQTLSPKFFSKIFILLALIISLKAFYVLYLLILIPIFSYLKKKDIKVFVISFFKNFYFYFFILIGLFLVTVNFFNTGCYLYPIEFTCFKDPSWSLHSEARLMNDWYEQWSKAGAGPDFRVENPQIYIQGFNWVSNWIDMYFFNKVSDFLAGLIFLSAIIFITFYSKKSLKIKIDKKTYITFIIILILLFEWFYNHPSLRYGGYNLIALIFFIPLSIYVSRFQIKNNLKKKLIILITLSLVIFVGRNINRIYIETDKYNYDILHKTYYDVNENHLRIDKFLKEITQEYHNCKNHNISNCIYQNIKIEKKNNYFLISKEKK